MIVNRKARGTKISKQAQRVFLCFDQKNINDKEKLINDLHDMKYGIDCVVSWLETSGESINEDDLREELHDTQVLVLWLTVELLQAISEKRTPSEFRIAQELKLPIIPISKDGSLFSHFTDLAGAIHGIAMSDPEYYEKLKNQLDAFFVTEELMKEIDEKAFNARIFLSYRKADIKKAREFMKKFHDLPGYQTISIWYDNFLTAGRVFDDEIKQSIIKSDVFALLVTPNLLEKNEEGNDNYVVSTEYPFAREQGKAIIPIESVKTDSVQFAQLFNEIGTTVFVDKSDMINAVFKENLGDSVFNQEMDSEQAYLLGMAYLKGLGVEQDYFRAIHLFENSADDMNSSALKAATQLAEICENVLDAVVQYERALYWRMRAAVISKTILGEAHPDTAKAYNQIANNYFLQKENDKALEWYQKSLEIYEKVFGREYPDTAKTYNDIADTYSKLKENDKALDWYQKAMEAREKIFGREHPKTSETYHNIASVYFNLEEYDNAIEWSKKALKIKEEVFGREHPDTADTYDNIAGFYSHKGEYEKALEWNQKALDINEKVHGKEHPKTAVTYNNRAAACLEQGEYDDALMWYHKALEIFLLVKENPFSADISVEIASIYTKKEDYKRALEYYKRALEIREKVLGDEHQKTAVLYYHVARNYMELGDGVNSIKWYHKALEVNEKVFGRDHDLKTVACDAIADNYAGQGEYDKALEWYYKSLANSEKVFGKAHPYNILVCGDIAGVYIKQEKYDEALRWYKKSLEFREIIQGKEHPESVDTYKNIAIIYRRQGEYEKEIVWSQKALAINEKVLGKEHPDIATEYFRIAGSCSEMEEYDKALEWYQKALEIREKVFGREHTETADVYNNMAGVYCDQREYVKALEGFKRAYNIYVRQFGENHPRTKATLAVIHYMQYSEGSPVAINEPNDIADQKVEDTMYSYHNNREEKSFHEIIMDMIEAGEINEAEDLLFDALESSADDNLRTTALCFYTNLKERDKDWLEAHDFSIKEVELGWKDFQMKYTQMK